MKGGNSNIAIINPFRELQAAPTVIEVRHARGMLPVATYTGIAAIPARHIEHSQLRSIAPEMIFIPWQRPTIQNTQDCLNTLIMLLGVKNFGEANAHIIINITRKI